MLAGPAQAATAHRKNIINPTCNDLINICKDIWFTCSYRKKQTKFRHISLNKEKSEVSASGLLLIAARAELAKATN
jgi:hypothetical protein